MLRVPGAGIDGLRRNDAANPSYVFFLVYFLRVPMPNYRRCRVAGGCHFFTVNLLERPPNDVLTQHVDVLRGGQGETGASVSHRCVGGVAGSSALRVDATGRR